MDHLKNLNPEQAAAVTATEGAVRVTAGPGTGKTMTLTSRYAYLVDTLGVSPSNILCATFTNKAANEMKKRIREKLGDLDLGYISTIHSFCLQLLREDIHVLGYPKNFVVLDKADQTDLMDQIFEETGLKMSDMTIKSALDEIIEQKKLSSSTYIGHVCLLNNDELKREYLETWDISEGIFLRYLYKQKKSFGLDFNDLINFALYILQHFNEVKDKWQQRIQYVMVDEFQDVSLKQYTLVDTLAGYHKNIFIVGDPDQTVYSWRGSHVRHFIEFTEIHQPSVSVSLPTNYRSTDQIIKATSSLIERNAGRLPYRQVGVKHNGTKPSYFRDRNVYLEAKWVAKNVRKLMEAGHSLNEVAVIYRAHHLSRPIEENFVKSKIPYWLYSGVAFYARKEIKDMISYLRMLTAADDIAFRRTINVPRRNVGRKTLAFVAQAAERNGTTLYQALKSLEGSPLLAKTQASAYLRAIETVRAQADKATISDLFQSLMDLTGYEAYLRLQGDQERLDNAAELKRAILDYSQDPDSSIDDFLAQAALYTNKDRDRPEETVKLMTIHAAKGLEFDTVFLIGLSEGSLPSKQALTPDEMEEERRLCYVACTRARERLFLSNSSGRAHEGDFSNTSRFVFDMGLNNLNLSNHPGNPPKGYVSLGPATRGERFEAGQAIVHPAWGLGLIVSVNEREANYQVQFERFNTLRTLRFDAPLSSPS